MKFLVDLPLGGLAKRLRFLGFDAAALRLSPAHPRSLPAPTQDTFILTRQEAFKGRPRPDLLVLNAATPEAQLKEVRRRLQLSRRKLAPLSRCSRCNEPLVQVDRSQVHGLVPEHVCYSQDRFYQCPRCRRLFWPGSHLRGIQKMCWEKRSEKDDL